MVLKPWYSGTETILNELKLEEENICLVKPHLNILYRNNWSKNVNEEAVIKLRNYALFKSIFQKEVYLETVKDVEKRKCLTQFKISAHQLEIESGRYKKRSVSERTCKFCYSDTVEDEGHFDVIVQPTILKENAFLN